MSRRLYLVISSVLVGLSLISGIVYGLLVWLGGLDAESWAEDVEAIGYVGVFFVIVVVFFFYGLAFSILVGLIGVIARFLGGAPASDGRGAGEEESHAPLESDSANQRRI